MTLVSEHELNRILLYYTLLEDIIQKAHENSPIKLSSLKDILDNRMKTFPTQFSTAYLLEALNIPKLKKKEIIKFEPLYLD